MNLRQQIHADIDLLPETQLVELAEWLAHKQALKRERILSYAGTWADLPESTWSELESRWQQRPASERRERQSMIDDESTP